MCPAGRLRVDIVSVLSPLLGIRLYAPRIVTRRGGLFIGTPQTSLGRKRSGCFGIYVYCVYIQLKDGDIRVG